MRTERVADQIRQEIASLLEYETKDPGIGFLTVTRVRVTPDLQAAHVYYTVLGEAAERRRTTRALDRASSFLRRQLAVRLQLRRTPELRFHYDEGVEQQARVERLLEEIAEARTAGAGEAGAGQAGDAGSGASGETTHDEHPDDQDTPPRDS